MKLYELVEAKDPTGTYAAARPTKDVADSIVSYIADNDIPNGCKAGDFHCTLLYSKRYCPNYTPAGKYDTPLKSKSAGLEIWPSRDGKNVLVLTLASKDLSARHAELMKEHDASYDFPEYKPHVSLSYDFGDGDVKQLPSLTLDIDFDTEYGEDLSD